MKILLYSDDLDQIDLVSDLLYGKDYTLLVEKDASSLFGHLKQGCRPN